MTNSIHQTLILTAAFFISSCDSTNEPASQPASTPIAEQSQEPMDSIEADERESASTTSELTLDDFKAIPDEIDGCACYFSETDQKFKENLYLFAAGYDSTGFVSVHNKLVKLKLTS